MVAKLFFSRLFTGLFARFRRTKTSRRKNWTFRVRVVWVYTFGAKRTGSMEECGGNLNYTFWFSARQILRVPIMPLKITFLGTKLWRLLDRRLKVDSFRFNDFWWRANDFRRDFRSSKIPFVFCVSRMCFQNRIFVFDCIVLDTWFCDFYITNIGTRWLKLVRV